MSILILVVASVFLTAVTAFQSPITRPAINRRHSIPFQSTLLPSQPSTSLSATTKSLDQIFGGLSLFPKTTNKRARTSVSVVEELLKFYNENDVTSLVGLLAEDCVWDDYSFYKPWEGAEAIERRLRLQASSVDEDDTKRIVIDGMAVGNTAVGVKFHSETNSQVIPNSRGVAVFDFAENGESSRIQKVSWVIESAVKSGEAGLKILSAASSIIDTTGYNPVKPEASKATTTGKNGSKLTAPEQYFAAWSARDLDAATRLFTDDATYDDTAFPEPFQGKNNLKKHLQLCADCFPESFTFNVDAVVGTANDNRLAVRWHVENDGEQLPFTRGISFYELDGISKKIRDGLDFVEPAVIKPGGINLFVQSMKQKIAQEPARLIPIAAWVAYMYIVFVSDGILPGANALQLEQRTWEEVRDLSLNFFLVAPALGLPFSPVVHPMLEGVFNLLLSWAAMFAGFLSDDRRNKPNLLPMLPTVVGMQFLTSAFLLPYLATRTTEIRNDVVKEDLPKVAQITERRLLGPAMAIVGTYSIVWAFIGRLADFGELAERWTSFIDLLSIDRVGSSFIVDLAIFAVFQGWFVDDDLKRRGVAEGDETSLRFMGKYVPFFGMAAYLALRPSYRTNDS